MTDAPYAVFRHVLQDRRFEGFTHVWSIGDDLLRERLQAEYRLHRNVRFVTRGSRQYSRSLATAKYLFNNSTFPRFFLPHERQVYVNTWHGTPLKHMGFRVDQPCSTENVLRNLLHARFIVSPNRHTTNIFMRDYKLAGFYRGTILEVGSPRSDLTMNADLQNIEVRLESSGIRVDPARKTVLYAPTWKGTNLSQPRNDVERIVLDLDRLEQEHGTGMQFLVKLHPYLYKRVADHPGLTGMLVPDTIDANEMLAVTDVLITDYSSMFFDFLVTGRPVVYYMWDSDLYRTSRDLYLEPDDLPGPVARDVDELSRELGELSTYPARFSVRYESMREMFCPRDDGGATQRLVDAVFFGVCAHSEQITCETEKTRILIYPGSMKNNGITEAFIALMDAIDHELYDVTMLWKPSADEEPLGNLRRVSPRVRQLFSPGRANRRVTEAFREQWTLRRGHYTGLDKFIYPAEFYEREARRCLAGAEFECAIDFSGYNMHWANVLDAVRSGRQVIYMHNDMLAERDKVIKGKKVHYHAVHGLMSVYSRFDAIVNVSDGQRAVNEASCSTYAASTPFVTVPNPVSTKRVTMGATDDSNLFQKGGIDVLVTEVKRGHVCSVPLPVPSEYALVNIGRLSPEKGQLELIEAFASVSKDFPHARLYIVGDGVLRDALAASIKSHGLDGMAHLVGYLPNPFFLLSQADMFVLSSHYEGQGLVLLEAMMLGVPVVSTDIPSSRTVLEDGVHGLLVAEGVDGLRYGIEQGLSGCLPSPDFDVETYNAAALERFHQVIAGDVSALTPEQPCLDSRTRPQ